MEAQFDFCAIHCRIRPLARTSQGGGSASRLRATADQSTQLFGLGIATVRLKGLPFCHRYNYLQIQAQEEDPSEPVEASDASLLCRFRRGDDDAATELYLRYARRLTTFAARQTSPQLATRFDPEDVIQSVFHSFFRRTSDGSFDVPQAKSCGNYCWSYH